MSAKYLNFKNEEEIEVSTTPVKIVKAGNGMRQLCWIQNQGDSDIKIAFSLENATAGIGHIISSKISIDLEDKFPDSDIYAFSLGETTTVYVVYDAQ